MLELDELSFDSLVICVALSMKNMTGFVTQVNLSEFWIVQNPLDLYRLTTCALDYLPGIVHRMSHFHCLRFLCPLQRSEEQEEGELGALR